MSSDAMRRQFPECWILFLDRSMSEQGPVRTWMTSPALAIEAALRGCRGNLLGK